MMRAVGVGCLALAAWVRAAGAQQRAAAPTGDPGHDVMSRTGWTPLVSDGCQYAVPAGWRRDRDGDLEGPDGSSLSVRSMRISNWSGYKAQVRAAFVHANVIHEDDDQRFWFEIGDNSRAQHFIAVVNASRVCAALLEVNPAGTPDAEFTVGRIAYSLGPVPTASPSWR
jgi:hypothetical protein